MKTTNSPQINPVGLLLANGHNQINTRIPLHTILLVLVEGVRNQMFLIGICFFFQFRHLPLVVTLK